MFENDKKKRKIGGVVSSKGGSSAGMPERGGVPWDKFVNYRPGDTASFNGSLYMANLGNANSQPDTDPLNWSEISGIERGGIAYNLVVEYQVGDLVFQIDNYYMALADGILGDPLLTPTDWRPLTTIERGGVLWNLEIEYLVGDTATDDGKFYTAILDSTGERPSNALSTFWKLTESFEKGGVIHDDFISYSAGDIVSSDTLPVKVFISTEDGNIGNDLPIIDSDAHWQLIDTIHYNSPTGGDRNGDGVWSTPKGAGEHCPWDSVNGTPGSVGVQATGANPLGEYPHTIEEKLGAIWRVSGLGRDVDGNSIIYELTTGTLIGRTVADGDTLNWVDHVTSGTPGDGSEIWLLSVAPRATNERGGVRWKTGGTYAIGDIVSENGLTYVHIYEDGLGYAPSASPADWKLVSNELGGVLYKTSTLYKVGDIITGVSGDPGSEITEVYRCAYEYTSGDEPFMDTIPQLFATELHNWVLVNGDSERGGVQWKVTTDYLVNDLVVDPVDLEIHRCLQDHTSIAGDVQDGAPSETNSDKWQSYAGPVYTIQDTFPTNPKEGDVNTTVGTNRPYLFNGTEWTSSTQDYTLQHVDDLVDIVLPMFGDTFTVMDGDHPLTAGKFDGQNWVLYNGESRIHMSLDASNAAGDCRVLIKNIYPVGNSVFDIKILDTSSGGNGSYHSFSIQVKTGEFPVATMSEFNQGNSLFDSIGLGVAPNNSIFVSIKLKDADQVGSYMIDIKSDTYGNTHSILAGDGTEDDCATIGISLPATGGGSAEFTDTILPTLAGYDYIKERKYDDGRLEYYIKTNTKTIDNYSNLLGYATYNTVTYLTPFINLNPMIQVSTETIGTGLTWASIAENTLTKFSAILIGNDKINSSGIILAKIEGRWAVA